MKVSTLLKSLPALTGYDFQGDDDCVETKVSPAEYGAFERDDRLYVSGENGLGYVDYYGEFRDGYAYIDPKLEAWAKARGGFWEWENPGCIYFCK